MTDTDTIILRSGSLAIAPAGRLRIWPDGADRGDTCWLLKRHLAPGVVMSSLRPGRAIQWDEDGCGEISNVRPLFQ